MKKIVCVVLLLVCFASYGFAQQTIEYCCNHYYKNGVKMKLEKPIFSYITFTDNYNRLYISDEYGNAIKLDNNIDSNDKYYYLNYISDYKPGDFKYHNYGEKYNILDVMYSIKLTYIGKDGKYSKNITYSIVHGN